ncbi:aminotransferase class IV [Homoserinimonas sp. OAct 916]|uniref:aminotransferase class IV n=1 Tax=Homoserinimonas sp. OAct 916 TaxID=2211450 RepID=UPI000DBDFFB2|nr:aminotransferase class IV [Homoserinimonas sp. OAct 916]
MVNLSYVWHPHEEILAQTLRGEATPHLLVADSWLVEDGLVRAISLHRDRFFRTARTWYTQPVLDSFWDAALGVLPGTGRWFPRVEVQEGTTAGTGPDRPRLALRLRTAPSTNRQMALASHRGPDPRTRPSVKGPDIPSLNAARAKVAPEADDTVILDARGHIVDGATTAILWWRGDTLVSPPSDLKRVDSITAKTIRLLASQTGIRCTVERAHVKDLAGCRVWAVNALHGIRSVSAWMDGPDLDSDDADDDRWVRSLAALRRPIR